MTGDSQRALTLNTIRTVALTLRQLAGWGVARVEMSDQEFYDLATQVEQIDPGWCCPMCQEATCDSECPLEPVREFDSAALRQVIVDGEARSFLPESPGRDTTEPDTAAVPGTDQAQP